LKCPECGNPNCNYTEKKKENKPRTNHEAKCSKCGFKGELKSESLDLLQTQETIVEKKKTQKIKMKYGVEDE